MAVTESGGRIVPVDLEQEMRRSYLDYAMSVIVDRALPDVRDGLKPVQRRILYAMSNWASARSAPPKSARIVGDVMGKYHPHGDAAIYDAMVRMAQDFQLPLPAGRRPRQLRQHRRRPSGGHAVHRGPPFARRHGASAGSGQGDRRLRSQLRRDRTAPAVLPARLPNLLVNGATGIAVGMATNIPPHNLGEVIDGLVRLSTSRRPLPRSSWRSSRVPTSPPAASSWARRASARRT